jgi:hypothetical protein
MSFAACAARSFTLSSILKNAPEEPGVYGLCNNREWIFIAEAGNIQASLLEQLNAIQSAVSLKKPTGFTFEVCTFAATPARKRLLLNQFRPSCNVPEPRPGMRRRSA